MEQPSTTTLSLPPTMDISSAEALYDMFRKAAEEDSDVVLEAAAVTRLSTPGIQLLLSLDNTLRQAGHSLSLGAPSEVMQQAFADLGLSNILQAWEKNA